MDRLQIEKSKKYSWIGRFSSCDLDYSMQYRTAFERLYESNTPIDTIALPLLYLLRHSIELALKYNTKYFHDYSKLQDKGETHTHILTNLSQEFENRWNKVKEIYSINCEEDGEYFKHLNSLIEKINTVDERSTELRYSHYKRSKYISWDEKIDIYEIKKLYDEVCPLLYNSIDYFEYTTGLMAGNTTKQELLDSPNI